MPQRWHPDGPLDVSIRSSVRLGDGAYLSRSVGRTATLRHTTSVPKSRLLAFVLRQPTSSWSFLLPSWDSGPAVDPKKIERFLD